MKKQCFLLISSYLLIIVAYLAVVYQFYTIGIPASLVVLYLAEIVCTKSVMLCCLFFFGCVTLVVGLFMMY